MVPFFFPMALVGFAPAGQPGGVAGLVLFGALPASVFGQRAPGGLGLEYGVAGCGSGRAHVGRVAAFVAGPDTALGLGR
jgi:hypothetical protein